MAPNTAKKAAGVIAAVGATVSATFIDFLRDTISIVSHRVRDDVDAVMDQVEFRVIVLQKRVLTQMIGYLALATAGLFVMLAAYFFLTATLGVSRAFVFGGIAVVLLIIGLILKYRAEGV